jgi:hypothetical protein
MVGRSTTRTLFSPGPKRESATSHGALPATGRAPLNGPQPLRLTPREENPPGANPAGSESSIGPREAHKMMLDHVLNINFALDAQAH